MVTLACIVPFACLSHAAEASSLDAPPLIAYPCSSF